MSMPPSGVWAMSEISDMSSCLKCQLARRCHTQFISQTKRLSEIPPHQFTAVKKLSAKPSSSRRWNPVRTEEFQSVPCGFTLNSTRLLAPAFAVRFTADCGGQSVKRPRGSFRKTVLTHSVSNMGSTVAWTVPCHGIVKNGVRSPVEWPCKKLLSSTAQSAQFLELQNGDSSWMLSMYTHHAQLSCCYRSSCCNQRMMTSLNTLSLKYSVAAVLSQSKKLPFSFPLGRQLTASICDGPTV
ncbi:hypothetical protein BC827DRAFT_395316 [Russula dissimulans]|nr:hypothetical protein BC827DRAFT_395316 [Russula dissimulans]